MTSGSVKVACIQVTSGPDVASNLAGLSPLVYRAADAGAQFVFTPENVALLEPHRARKFAEAENEAAPRIIPFFAELARANQIWLMAGSIAVHVPGEDRLANRSYLFDPHGDVVATYDKIHMFDVDLAGGESYRESAQFRPGDRTVLAATPWGLLGMTICYDLRFPALYRLLAHAGAVMLSVPASFTVPTGQAHWHTLLRARAIENGCYIMAPAQTGTHGEGRKTYGHSLIISPWGEILADAGAEPGVITATLDLGLIAECRTMISSLQHDRPLPAPVITTALSATRSTETNSPR